MKLSAGSDTLEVHGDVTEHDFGIGDPFLILEYLTNSVYSDKPGIIVQEIASNSRDAHREIGQKRKIQIKLPSRLDPTLSFIDHGPGISPERIKNVYTKYGNSTKRTDNVQTGGFGVGCKVMFCYTDAFQVRTIAKENKKLVLREYSMVKGENRKLQCIEMGQGIVIDVNDPTVPDDDKMTGTTVTMNVNSQDIETFKQKILKTCKWWDDAETPEILNGSITFPPLKARICEGNDWMLLTEKETNSSGYEATEPTVVIDGIPYPLSAQPLGIGYGHDLQPLMNPHLVVFFNTGELSLALSREALQYDQSTKDRLIKKLTEVYDALKQQVDDKLKNCSCLWDAVVLYQELEKSFSINQFVKKVKWNGILISNDKFHCSNWIAGLRNYTKENDSDGIHITGSKADSLYINKKRLWVICDEEQMSILKLHTLFNTNSHIDTITVIKPQEKWAEFCKENNIGTDNITYTNLSTIEKYKRPKNAVDSTYKPRPVVKAYRYSGHSDSSRNMWAPVDVDLDECEGAYVLLERYKATDCKHELIPKVMMSLGDKIQLIGIPERFAKQIGDSLLPLKDYVQEKKYELENKLDFKSIAQDEADKDYIMGEVYGSSALEMMAKIDFGSLITNTSSPFLLWLIRSHQIETTKTDFQHYANCLEFLGETPKLPAVTADLKLIAKECQERYLLLDTPLRNYYHNRNEFNKLAVEMAFYINSKDAAMTPKKNP